MSISVDMSKVDSAKAKKIYKKTIKKQQSLPFKGAIKFADYDKKVSPDLDEMEREIGSWLFKSEVNPYTKVLKEIEPAMYAWACPPGIRDEKETVYHIARSCVPLLQDVSVDTLLRANPDLDEDNSNYPLSPVEEFLQACLDPEREKALERSIETFGLLQPPLITIDHEIIIGKRRVKALMRILSKYQYDPGSLKITCIIYPVRGKGFWLHDNHGKQTKVLEAYIDHIRGEEALTHRAVEGEARKELRKKASLDRYIERVAEDTELLAESGKIIKQLSETVNRLSSRLLKEDRFFAGALEEAKKLIAEIAEFDNELPRMLKNKDERELARKKLAFYRKMADMMQSYGYAFHDVSYNWNRIKNIIKQRNQYQKENQELQIYKRRFQNMEERLEETYKELEKYKKFWEEATESRDEWCQQVYDLKEELEEARKELERLKAEKAGKKEIEAAEDKVDVLEDDLNEAHEMVQHYQQMAEKFKTKTEEITEEKRRIEEEAETLKKDIEKLNFILKQKDEEIERNREELTERYKHQLAQELEERVAQIRAEYSEKIREKEEEILRKYQEKKAKLDEKIKEFEEKSQLVEEQFLNDKKKLIEALEKAQSQGKLLDVLPKKDKETVNNIISLNLTLETLFAETHRLVQVLQGSTKRLEKGITSQMKTILKSYLHFLKVNISIVGGTLIEANKWLAKLEAIVGIEPDGDGNGGGPGGGKKTEKNENSAEGEAVQQDTLVAEAAEGVTAMVDEGQRQYRDRGAELLKNPYWHNVVEEIVKSYRESNKKANGGMDNNENYSTTKLFLKKRSNIENKFAELGYKVPKLKKGETLTEHFEKFLEDMKAKGHPYYEKYKELVNEYNRLKAETWSAWYNFAEQAARQICAKYGGGLTFDEIDPSGELEKKISGALEQALDRMKTVNPNYVKSWVMQKIQSALQIKSAPTILILGDEEFIGNCKAHLQLDKYFIHTASDTETAELKLQEKLDCIMTNLPVKALEEIFSKNPKLKKKKFSFMFINSEENMEEAKQKLEKLEIVEKATFEEIPFGLGQEIDFYEIMDSFLNSNARFYQKRVRRWNPLLGKSFDQIIDGQGEMQSQMKSMKFLSDSFPFYLAHENGIIPQERRGPPHNMVQQAKA